MISQINLPDSKVRISAFGVPPFSGIQTLFDMSKKKVVNHQDAMLCARYTTCTVQNRYKIKTGDLSEGYSCTLKTICRYKLFLIKLITSVSAFT